jgi:hypothetical protein
MIESRYSSFDVMRAAAEWDPHTRQVIEQRLKDPGPLRHFSPAEGEILTDVVKLLLHENDPFLIAKVVEQIDQMLADGEGEGYRPATQPPDSQFWREGLAALGADFASCPPSKQEERLTQLQTERKPFFHALLKQAVTGYCSLPPVWSFMGYGGPAYPRGYVRIELGLRDPWEAKPDARE